MRSIVTIGCLLVVLLDNGPTAPWIRPDLPGRPRRVTGGCATPINSPDKAEVSGSSPLRPTSYRTRLEITLKVQVLGVARIGVGQAIEVAERRGIMPQTGFGCRFLADGDFPFDCRREQECQAQRHLGGQV